MAKPTVGELPQPSTRELRSLQLFRECGAEIVRTAPYTYLTLFFVYSAANKLLA